MSKLFIATLLSILTTKVVFSLDTVEETNSNNESIFILHFKSNDPDENIRIEKVNEAYREVNKINIEIESTKTNASALLQKLEHTQEDVAVGDKSKEDLNKLKNEVKILLQDLVNKQKERLEALEKYIKRLSYLMKSSDDIVKKIVEQLSNKTYC